MTNTTNWSFLQSVEEIEIGRFFEYDEDALTNFSKWLSFLKKFNMKVLEIGAGTGFFTQKLLAMFPGTILHCLEPDPNFYDFLTKKFEGKIPIINQTIEKNSLETEGYDCVITHIVLHNLTEPLHALKEMTRLTKQNGWVVVIEPLAASRHYFPTEELTKANDFLEQATRYRCMERYEQLEVKPQFNPWNYCYPQLMAKAGLRNIHCYGWTSIFTLSDDRYNYQVKKTWLKRRHELFKNQQEELTTLLLKNNHERKQIDEVIMTFEKYFTQLEQLSEEEMLDFHEQEIVHRMISIGRKTK